MSALEITFTCPEAEITSQKYKLTEMASKHAHVKVNWTKPPVCGSCFELVSPLHLFSLLFSYFFMVSEQLNCRGSKQCLFLMICSSIAFAFFEWFLGCGLEGKCSSVSNQTYSVFITFSLFPRPNKQITAEHTQVQWKILAFKDTKQQTTEVFP